MNLRVRFSIGTILGAIFMALGVVTAGAAASLTSQAGGASADQAVQVPSFFPATLTVNVGDTVTWTLGSGEVHTVTLGKPPFQDGDVNAIFVAVGGPNYDGTSFVNSGLIYPAGAPGPSKFALTFTKAGSFTYFCLLHQSMQATVVVQAAGSAYPAAQATYNPATDPVMMAALQTGAAAMAATKATAKANGNGSKTYSMNAGTGDGKTYMVERFGVASLSISVGDSVTWSNPDLNEIHTVTFLSGGKDVAILTPDSKVNPVAAAPAGGPTYNGTGFTNSGILSGPDLPGQAPSNSYTLKFTKAGSYGYVCIVHDDLGMKGTINVAALPQLPKTGGSPGLIVLGLGVVGLGLISGGLALRRRDVSKS